MHVRPRKIFRLLTTCLGINVAYMNTVELGTTGPISRAYFLRYRDLKLIKYLSQPKTSCASVDSQRRTKPTQDHADHRGDDRCDRNVLEMLLTRLKTFEHSWESLSQERASNIGPDIVQIVTSLCVVAYASASSKTFTHASLCKNVLDHSRQLWDMVCKFIAEHGGENLQALLTTTASTVLALRTTQVCDTHGISFDLSPLAAPLLNMLHQYLGNSHTSRTREHDVMELDESPLSQSSQGIVTTSGSFQSREDTPFLNDENLLMTALTVDFFIQHRVAYSQPSTDHETASSTVDFLLSLSPEDLLSGRKPALEFLALAPSIQRSEVYRLLERLGLIYLQDDNFEMCEAALCFCLDAMTTLVTFWASDVDDELSGIASDMYGWFLKAILRKGRGSPRVLVRIARMLEAILQRNSTWNKDISAPSPRTALFKILHLGENVVKYHVANLITHILKRFVLTEHDAILDDIVESLPADTEHIEGIAMRLWVFGELASAWHTLLRRSVYYLFETPAHVPQSLPYAQHCLERVCCAIDLESPRALFRLFSSQILYTWLGKETFDSIPFALYGYATLLELLEDVRDELVGQFSMRGFSQQIEQLSQHMRTSPEDLIEASFSQVEAYTIARDISLPPTENQDKSTESLVRKELGTDVYLQQVRNSFPQIVSHLFIALSEEAGIERAFAKRREYASANAVLQEIQQLSRSEIVLPPGQQPAFRAKYLLDELEFLCQRIGEVPSLLWTAPMTVFVARALLDSAVPSLGPLYACSALRKIRIMVALAGPSAVQGYPLEMLLHALRPYLTEFYCSEDALGIFWYLLDKGKPFLRKHPSYLLGIAVSACASMSDFMQSSQDSTTQESHFRSALSKAQKFRDWFGHYLAHFRPTEMTADRRTAFERITGLAQKVGSRGTSIRGSHEGDLLYELLDDQTSRRRLLSLPAFDLAVQIICKNFDLPTHTNEDILGMDERAAHQLPVIWDVLRRLNVAGGFRTWAAQILGRVYASTGKVHCRLLREHSPAVLDDVQVSDILGRHSHVTILGQLQKLLFSANCVEAGIAEQTLQTIISQLSVTEAASCYDQYITPSLLTGLCWIAFPPPLPRHGPAASQKERPALERWDGKLSLHQWASNLSVALVTKFGADPILGPLYTILIAVPNVAVEIFPFLVHNALVNDSEDQSTIRQSLSSIFSDAVKDLRASVTEHHKLILRTLLYLRYQPLPHEATMADRVAWLDVDLGEAASAAARCKLYKTALLLLELQASRQALQTSRPRLSRRSSVAYADEPIELKHLIYQSLDDPDFFYGIQEQASMISVLAKLDHEHEGIKSISFQSAIYDAELKLASGKDSYSGAAGLLKALSTANLNGLGRAVYNHTTLGSGSVLSDSMLQVALNLQQWDLPDTTPDSESSGLVPKAFHHTEMLRNEQSILRHIDTCLLDAVEQLLAEDLMGKALYRTASTLATLADIKDVLSSRGLDDIEAQWQTMTARNTWMQIEE